MTKRPLDGIRVIELTHVWAGPLCGQILADLGAEVIRVENRARLDIHRRGGPYPDGTAGVNRSGTWNAQNRGKLGCTLDIKTIEGRDLLFSLVRESDVLIENFTPGTLNRLGVGFARLCEANQRIVLVSLSGYGQTGPHAGSLAYGPMMDAATGLSAATMYDDGIPRAVNGWAADIGGALYGCAAALRALLDEPRVARHIDISQFEAGVMFGAEALMLAANGSPSQRRVDDGFAATVLTQDADGWIAVAARTMAEITALHRLLGGQSAAAPEWRGDEAAMQAQFGECKRVLAHWAMALPIKEALGALARAGIPAVPVTTVEGLLDDRQLQESGAWVTVDHPETGPTRSYACAVQLTGTPPMTRAAPLLGGDNDYVFRTILGLSPERVDDLVKRQVL